MEARRPQKHSLLTLPPGYVEKALFRKKAEMDFYLIYRSHDLARYTRDSAKYDKAFLEKIHHHGDIRLEAAEKCSCVEPRQQKTPRKKTRCWRRRT